ncbi:MAG: hypothetical protein H6702_08885 [Myxococcales bacterium]|nr:hypothetical protein [Myxococcales bacterium]
MQPADPRDDDLLDDLEDLARGFATESSPRLERMGLGYFRRRDEALGPTEVDDAIHVLDQEERDGLLKIQRRTVFRAGLAGALSAGLAAGAELWAHPLEADRPVAFWAIVLGVTAVAAVAEIAFLYWDALRAVHAMARVAGVPLFGDVSGRQQGVALSLVRAALELPDPPENPYGINPLREVSPLLLAAAALLYKAKIALTGFLIKALIRRAMGRVLVRAWLVLVAIPVTAVWNAVVAWRVLRQARIRAMGPSAAQALVDALGPLEAASVDCARRAVASAAVRSAALHPNLAALIGALPTGAADGPPLDDPRAFLARLQGAPAESQRVALRVLAFAAVVDGVLTRGERALLAAAGEACGRPLSAAGLRTVRGHLTGGRALTPERLDEAFGA